ncbi:MAG: tRNA (adenosine(37)-N6)-dimethylallyltransferase MiaA [Akkermansia sp.]|nr:tRNA (adenosine(37)-N6)-dimethylallyltransferase MiaA [Akkermansia sp.]
MTTLPQPIFILGPTGCGKSAVAVALAERLARAEIVSADAYQVYREMPILTAAPSAAEMARVPHHLVGCMGVHESNDAATHARKAQTCIEQIQQRGLVPIVTGGSGLYVKFISHGISPAPPSDEALRAELTALPLEEVVRRLQEADPEGAAATDLQNPRYVVRNLEIVLVGGKPLSYWKNNWIPERAAGPGFCLVRDTVDLDARIARRAAAMAEQGVLQEVEQLLAATEGGKTLSHTAVRTLGLEQVQRYLAGECSLADMVAELALATRQYAKRQRTWLRREKWLTPVEVAPEDSCEAVCARVLSALGVA